MSDLPLNVSPILELSNDFTIQLRVRVETTLHAIIKQNLSSQFGRTADVLASFRESLAGVNMNDRAAVASAFDAARVPMTEYDQYAPYVSKFFQPTPCAHADVVDLLAPGLPLAMGMSSATSGKASKPIPKYMHYVRRGMQPGQAEIPKMPHITIWENPANQLAVRPVYCGYSKFAEVHGVEGGESERESGNDAITRIPCTTITGVMTRAKLGFLDWRRDHERLAEPVPDHTGPWGIALITNYRSMILTHAAFALAAEPLDTLSMSWATTFIDFVRLVDEEWEMLVDGISTGVLPRFAETEHVYTKIASVFKADPERAAALRKVGPPSQTTEGWTVKVWPKLELLIAVCTGTFGRVYPQVRACIGPNIPIRPPFYACTEATIGGPYDDRIPNIVKVSNMEYIEMLEVTSDNEDGELKSMWEVEAGKVYEPVLTTHDGLWRYRTRDAVQVIGFSPLDGTPLLEYKERRNQSMWIAQALVSQSDILSSISGVREFSDVEFTSWWDDRSQPATVGLFLEATPQTRSIASSVRDKILTGLLAANENFASGAKRGLPVRPSIRLLAPGTFREFKTWKGNVTGAGATQIKLPIIMLNQKDHEFLLEKVIGGVE
ncbi:hypothetical protein CONPUDRAFT_154107 [Coniophora puteana RWD-64-598 SS2]|uniref:GH3 middle domain-containing protein n=1 Tax=Coniophora puteana (strain RWD-64-598) TaxID=741705 RepID=A0A5M3MS54_CONPW|nr:uncharacterized protein CONPUDRAFT_154107 [Coniophora puteana RWD-64-598 SS2]EIW81574.1 hypothetical protein CONPUDRAFT_154107 [Coniophora puteana RWD-64-598 SS2]